MGTALQSMAVAFLAASEGTEQVELTRPWERVTAEAGDPVLVSPEPGEIQMFNHLDQDGRMAVDVPVASAREADFAALVLPGGVANPDQLRTNPAAVDFVRSFFDAGKPVASICHAPWTIIEADRARGRTITSWPSLRTDVRNAGGTWVDEEVVECTSGPNVLVSSRRPPDLPAFCDAMVKAFAAQAAGAGRR